MTISPAYAEQNRQLHSEHEAYGISGGQWAAYVQHLIEAEELMSLLDFGCGKSNLAMGLRAVGVDTPIAEYDPAIPGKEMTPKPAELVTILDVLEHCEPEHIDALLAELARLTRKRLLFDICLVPAKKTLPDGRNAHLLVQPPDWWRYKLSQHFDIVHWVERDYAAFVYGEAVPKGHPVTQTKCCRMTLELSSMFANILEQSAQHCDAFSRIASVRMFTGVRDNPADMQIIYDLLEDIAEPGPLLAEVSHLARKAVMAWVKLTPERDAAYWKTQFEAYWRIFEVKDEQGIVCIVAFPRVGVEGITPIGAVASEERWVQVESAMARISKRIEPAAAHGRKAILACYGPSLKETVLRLKAEREEGDCEVISVSGAHDFLLEHGIVPDYHVECDPRPHKADNIVKGHTGIRYLIASVAHPVLFDKLDGLDIALWHVSTKEHGTLLLKAGENGHHIISGGGSVGLRAVPLFYALGYRDFSIYGMDCSFADEGKQQWAGKHAGKTHKVVHLQCEGRVFATSPTLATYATDFIEMVQKVTDAQFRLYGDGLLQAMCVVHAQLAQRQAA